MSKSPQKLTTLSFLKSHVLRQSLLFSIFSTYRGSVGGVAASRVCSSPHSFSLRFHTPCIHISVHSPRPLSACQEGRFFRFKCPCAAQIGLKGSRCTCKRVTQVLLLHLYWLPRKRISTDRWMALICAQRGGARAARAFARRQSPPSSPPSRLRPRRPVAASRRRCRLPSSDPLPTALPRSLR